VLCVVPDKPLELEPLAPTFPPDETSPVSAPAAPTPVTADSEVEPTADLPAGDNRALDAPSGGGLWWVALWFGLLPLALWVGWALRRRGRGPDEAR